MIKTHILESPPFQCCRDNKIEAIKRQLNSWLQKFAANTKSEAGAGATGFYALSNCSGQDNTRLLPLPVLTLFARGVDLPGVFYSKKIGELAVVFTIVNNEVGKFAGFD